MAPNDNNNLTPFPLRPYTLDDLATALNIPPYEQEPTFFDVAILMKTLKPKCNDDLNKGFNIKINKDPRTVLTTYTSKKNKNFTLTQIGNNDKTEGLTISGSYNINDFNFTIELEENTNPTSLTFYIYCNDKLIAGRSDMFGISTIETGRQTNIYQFFLKMLMDYEQSELNQEEINYRIDRLKKTTPNIQVKRNQNI